MKNPFSQQTHTESKLKLMISVGTLERYLYVSIIILRFTALILASFFQRWMCHFIFIFFAFFRFVSVDRLIWSFFCASFIFLFYRQALASIYSFLYNEALSSFKQIRLLVSVFVPFQFNGYFLLFTVKTLRIVTYFHRNGEKNTRTKFKSITFFLPLHIYIQFGVNTTTAIR